MPVSLQGRSFPLCILHLRLKSLDNTQTKRSRLDQILDRYVKQSGIFVTVFVSPLLLLNCAVKRWGIDGPPD